MKKILNSTWLWILVFILGILVLLYPTISNEWNKRVTESLLVEFDQSINNITPADKDKILEDAIKYNASLVGNILPDAFAEEEANKPNELYETILNPLNNGFMCTVEVPVINVKIPVFHYTTEVVLQKGAGHLPGSSVPVGGLDTHSVLSAHRGLPSAKLFTDLDLVKEQDIFYLHVLGDILAYEVDLIKVIEPDDTSDLGIVRDKDYCTLFTCTPYAVNSHRLLVRGHRIDFNPDQYLAEQEKSAGPKMWYILIQVASALIGLIIAIVILVINDRYKNRKNKDEKRIEKPVVEALEESNNDKERK